MLKKHADKIVLVAIAAVIVAFAYNMDRKDQKIAPPVEMPPEEKVSQEETWYVHVAGAVVSPGVYAVTSGDRLLDAVAMAGGFAEGADEDGVNLALKLEDEMKIRIPFLEEATSEETSEPVQSADAGKIDINVADVKDLTELPGIGEQRATDIVEYREKNPFRKIEDIMNVPGIGEKTFEGFGTDHFHLKLKLI